MWKCVATPVRFCIVFLFLHGTVLAHHERYGSRYCPTVNVIGDNSVMANNPIKTVNSCDKRVTTGVAGKITKYHNSKQLMFG